jgi:transcription antitermination factor NusG
MSNLDGKVLKQWLAIYTKPRWEKKVNNLLLNKGIESWCPLQKKVRQWSDRKKTIEEPLFKSYVFVYINNKTERTNVLSTDGVLNFVYYLGKPAIIKDEEINNIKHYLSETSLSLELIALEGFKQDDKVRINHGVFMDNEGTVLRSGKKKVYVEIKTLGRLLVVEFPVEYLLPLK